MAGKNVPTPRKRPVPDAKGRPGDEKLLQRMAALISAHPDLDVAETMQAVGVDNLADQRRVRKQFELRREELVGAADKRRAIQLPKDPSRTAALKVAAEERVSAPAEATAAVPGSPDAEPRRLPLPAADRLAAVAAMPCGAGPSPSASVAAVQPLVPFAKAGLEALTMTVNMQSKLLDVWLQMPGVKLALAQQATAYNAFLGMVVRSLPKRG